MKWFLALDPNPATCTAASPPAVYSIFSGRKPYLDEYLAEQGRLVFVDTIEKVDLINIKSRDRMSACGEQRRTEFRCQNPDLVKQVVGQLMELAKR